MKPLSKIASGGEIARIMLALKSILAQVDDVETVVFDEADPGIGGLAAASVAQKIFEIARTRQVICITHFPQSPALPIVISLFSRKEARADLYQGKRLSQEERIRNWRECWAVPPIGRRLWNTPKNCSILLHDKKLGLIIHRQSCHG